jgi:hypothetical protein
MIQSESYKYRNTEDRSNDKQVYHSFTLTLGNKELSEPERKRTPKRERQQNQIKSNDEKSFYIAGKRESFIENHQCFLLNNAYRTIMLPGSRSIALL